MKRRYNFIKNNKRGLNESIQSNYLKNWFAKHGGVKNTYGDNEYTYMVDRRVRQDGLSDVTDDMILYTREYDNLYDAWKKRLELITPTSRNKRSDWDIEAFFTVYQAKDGACLLVGVDRNKIQTKPVWGGEMTAKTADRVISSSNDRPFSLRYRDDSDTYYYTSPRKTGLYNNRDYKNELSFRSSMNEHYDSYDDEDEDYDPFKEYQDDYPKGDFNASDMTKYELADWCDEFGDFYYIYSSFGRKKLYAANNDNIIEEIKHDVYTCNYIEPTHEVDYVFDKLSSNDLENLFREFYVCVFKICPNKEGLYIVYLKEKY